MVQKSCSTCDKATLIEKASSPDLSWYRCSLTDKVEFGDTCCKLWVATIYFLHQKCERGGLCGASHLRIGGLTANCGRCPVCGAPSGYFSPGCYKCQDCGACPEVV